MWGDSEQVLDSIFLSYNKILKRFKLLGVTTKDGKEITHEDLRKAVSDLLRMEQASKGLGQANLNWWIDDGISIQTEIILNLEKLEDLRTDIEFIKAIILIQIPIQFLWNH